MHDEDIDKLGIPSQVSHGLFQQSDPSLISEYSAIVGMMYSHIQLLYRFFFRTSRCLRLLLASRPQH